MARLRKVRKRKVNRAALAEARVEAVLHPREEAEDSGVRVVLVGNQAFNLELEKALADHEGFSVVAKAETHMDAFAYPNELNAELVLVDADFGGSGEGVAFARDLNERTPGCAFMIVCGALTPTVTKSLWIFGADSWSFITLATAQMAAHFAGALSSAVHGMPWVDPEISRQLRAYGPRPRSLDARKLHIFESEQADSA